MSCVYAKLKCGIDLDGDTHKHISCVLSSVSVYFITFEVFWVSKALQLFAPSLVSWISYDLCAFTFFCSRVINIFALATNYFDFLKIIINYFHCLFHKKGLLTSTNTQKLESDRAESDIDKMAEIDSLKKEQEDLLLLLSDQDATINTYRSRLKQLGEEVCTSVCLCLCLFVSLFHIAYLCFWFVGVWSKYC